MSEKESVQEQIEEPKRFQLTKQTRTALIVSACVLLVFFATIWSGKMQTERVKREVFENDIAAIAASLKYPMLESKSLRSGAGKERIQTMASEISSAGKYELVLISDETGKILGTTDKNLEREKIDTESFPEKGCEVKTKGSSLTAEAPIVVGDTPIGFIRVVANR